MAPFSTPLPTHLPSPSPVKRRWRLIPSPNGGLQAAHDLLGALRVLARQSAVFDDPLGGFRHVQPRPAERRVERHDSVVEQPEHKGRGPVSGEIVQNQQETQRGQLSRQRDGALQARLPALPDGSIHNRVEGRGSRQMIQNVGQFDLKPRMQNGIRHPRGPFRPEFAAGRAK
jgi:hypothetical protein